jgi:hypothetical protein
MSKSKEEGFQTIQLQGHGADKSKSFTIIGKQDGNKVVGAEYSLNLSDNTRIVHAYDKLDEEEAIYTVLAEIQQNVMDWVSEKLYDESKSKNPPRLGIDTFTHAQGLYGKGSVVDISNKKKTITIESKVSKSQIMTEWVREHKIITGGTSGKDDKKPSDLSVHFVQKGRSMLSADLLNFSTTTKNKTSPVPQAGGHGVGLKQLFALFASKKWEFVMFGTIPLDGYQDRLVAWHAIRKGTQFGIRGSFYPRTPDYLAQLLGSSTSKNLPADFQGQFMCTRVTWPSNYTSIERLWSALKLSHVVFTLQEEKTMHVWNQGALIHNNNQTLGAYYINGVPIAFTGLKRGHTFGGIQEMKSSGVEIHNSVQGFQPTLHVLMMVTDIREYSQMERVASSKSTRIESNLKHEFEGVVYSSFKSELPLWFKTIIHKAKQNHNSPEGGTLFHIDSSDVRRAVGKFLEWDQAYRESDLNRVPELKQYQIKIPENRIVQDVTQKKELEPLINWLTTSTYDPIDDRSMPGHEFLSTAGILRHYFCTYRSPERNFVALQEFEGNDSRTNLTRYLVTLFKALQDFAQYGALANDPFCQKILELTPKVWLAPQADAKGGYHNKQEIKVWTSELRANSYNDNPLFRLNEEGDRTLSQTTQAKFKFPNVVFLEPLLKQDWNIEAKVPKFEQVWTRVRSVFESVLHEIDARMDIGPYLTFLEASLYSPSPKHLASMNVYEYLYFTTNMQSSLRKLLASLGAPAGR